MVNIETKAVEIVDIPSGLPESRTKRKYIPLLESLPFDKSLKYSFKTPYEASVKASGFRTAVRITRQKTPLKYKIITRIVNDKDVTTLYIWKVK
jgi:hypothetical protein